MAKKPFVNDVVLLRDRVSKRQAIYHNGAFVIDGKEITADDLFRCLNGRVVKLKFTDVRLDERGWPRQWEKKRGNGR